MTPYTFRDNLINNQEYLFLSLPITVNNNLNQIIFRFFLANKTKEKKNKNISIIILSIAQGLTKEIPIEVITPSAIERSRK